MLGPTPSFTAQLAAERRARLAADAAGARWRRILGDRHTAPSCGILAAELPDIVLDVRPGARAEAAPAART